MDPTKPLGPAMVTVCIITIIVLATLPFYLVRDSEFGGSDGVGSEIVAELAPDYNTAWIQNIWTPPGGETESMLFALQAAVGGILIGYCFGYLQGSRSDSPPIEENTNAHH
jgi:cobalt/nickel transport protein